jgi:AcrR family transcriptional regulator
MTGRPVDHQRRAELLDAVVDYTVEHDFSEVSWRPLAAALGITPTTLVHHFGSKEQMLAAILGRLRERILAASSYRADEQPDLATAARSAWTRTSDPGRWPEFKLFFAVYGRALQAPQQFAEFLDRVVADWMGVLVDAQGPDTDPATATRMATLVIATIRGLLLDLLATGDRDRVQEAAEAFLATLEGQGAPAGTAGFRAAAKRPVHRLAERPEVVSKGDICTDAS